MSGLATAGITQVRWRTCMRSVAAWPTLTAERYALRDREHPCGPGDRRVVSDERSTRAADRLGAGGGLARIANALVGVARA